MAKKKAREVTLSISQHVIDEVMAEIGYRVGSIGAGQLNTKE